MSRRLLIGAFAGLAWLTAATAAGAVPWRTSSVGLRADQQPAAQLLRMFAAEQGVLLEIAEGTVAPVSGDFRGLAPTAFLDAVCESAELTWFWDGGRLHVGPARDVRSRVVELPNVTLPQVNTALSALGFASGPASRSSQVRGGDGIFTLSGGPAYLEHGAGEPLVGGPGAPQQEHVLLVVEAQHFRARLALESGDVPRQDLPKNVLLAVPSPRGVVAEPADHALEHHVVALPWPEAEHEVVDCDFIAAAGVGGRQGKPQFVAEGGGGKFQGIHGLH